MKAISLTPFVDLRNALEILAADGPELSPTTIEAAKARIDVLVSELRKHRPQLLLRFRRFNSFLEKRLNSPTENHDVQKSWPENVNQPLHRRRF